MAEPKQPVAATIRISGARQFGPGAMLAVNAWGLVLIIPVVLAVIAMSLAQFAWLMLLLPLLAIAVSAFILPMGLGNAQICRLLRRQDKPDSSPASSVPEQQSVTDGRAAHPSAFVVQATLWPRARSGLSGLMEDADDFGVLKFSAAGVVFAGDSICCELPNESITSVTTENVGWRGLFVYGSRIRVTARGLTEVEWIEFAERSSWVLTQSRRVTRQIRERFELALRAAK